MAPLVEDCQNGVDDDQNGQIDCEDAACAPGYECVPEIPAGLSASWVIDIAYPTAITPPACPDGKPAEIDYVGPAMSTDCGACDCIYSGYTCTGPSVECAYYDYYCNGSVNVFAWPTNTCVDFPGVPGSINDFSSCRIIDAPKLSTKGNCASTESKLQNVNTWERQLFVCPVGSKTGKGCAAGGACIPKNGGDFANASICVVLTDPLATCPAGFTKTEVDAYDDGTDDRACTSCACDTNSVTCKGGSVTVYDTNACTAGGSEGPVQLPTNGTCQSLYKYVDNGQASLKVEFATATGTCTQPAGTGSVTPTGPRKVCCQ